MSTDPSVTTLRLVTGNGTAAPWENPEQWRALGQQLGVGPDPQLETDRVRAEAEQRERLRVAADRERRDRRARALLDRPEVLVQLMVQHGFGERTSRLVCGATDPWAAFRQRDAKAVRGWAESPELGIGLVVIGERGTRKTGAMHAAGRHLLLAGREARYVRAGARLAEVLAGRSDEARERLEQFRGCTDLVLDDVAGEYQWTGYLLAALTDLVDERGERTGFTTTLVTNCADAHAFSEHLGKQLDSRLRDQSRFRLVSWQDTTDYRKAR